MVIARPGGHRDPAYLSGLILAEKVTVAHFVPSLLEVFLDFATKERCASLRHVICSGETMPARLKNRFFEKFDAGLRNLYGPAEASIDVTCHRCSKKNESFVPIGLPAANTRVNILDESLQALPANVPGELCIGGVQVARGYRGHPGLTAEKFPPDPFCGRPGARMYRTGDLGFRTDRGEIEFIGRIDRQIKIRGIRIEPGEIEAVLTSHPDVKNAAVLAIGPPEKRGRLSARIVRSSSKSRRKLADELGELADKKLPACFRPDEYVFMKHFPLNRNGKIDFQALGEMKGKRRQASFIEPAGRTERKLAELYRRVLRTKRVGLHDNFFDLGGHSLMIPKLHALICDTFAANLEVDDLFRWPTVASMSRFLEDGARTASDRSDQLKEGASRLSKLRAKRKGKRNE